MEKNVVFVGMSGGVDSSVAALRLKQAGYAVTGVFIKVWQPDFLDCHWEEERLDAMRVAAHLEIPFLTCDAEEAYRTGVGEYFVNEYIAGRTPNPDVMCNQHIKFGAFLEFAKERGAQYIATGHYAQVVEQDGCFQLHRGVDADKDQSYFLWTLTQSELKCTLLPVGMSTKEAIRVEAKRAGLPTASKKDSQGVCFLGHIDIPEFLSHFIDLEPGSVLDESGATIGTHKGAIVYTLGQRHGFSITKNSTTDIPLYVTERDIEENTITVAAAPLEVPPKKAFELKEVNWIGEQRTGNTETQFRYRQKPFPCEVTTEAGVTRVEPQQLITEPAAGQSCVLYQGSHCLGGGILT